VPDRVLVVEDEPEAQATLEGHLTLRGFEVLTAASGEQAHAILTRPSRECTGNFFLAEDVLVEEGVADFTGYAAAPGAEPLPDLYVDEIDPPSLD